MEVEMLNRRSLLQMGVLGCTCCAAIARGLAATAEHASAPGAPAHWGYEGDGRPERWGELQPDFKVCQLGIEQAPIDLAGGITGDAGAVALDYKPLALRVINNGHTIQVNADSGLGCTIGGTRYELLQFHFHHPSEHLFAGKPFDLECHFVHRSSAGNLAVVGTFIRPGARNATLQMVFDAMPSKEGPEVRAAGSVDPVALMPKSGAYFRYMGSLTTPPCSEGVTWTMFREPIEAAPEQIRQFAALFANNARPVQRLNRRFLINAN
jgi:carbonic anhydrase